MENNDKGPSLSEEVEEQSKDDNSESEKEEEKKEKKEKNEKKEKKFLNKKREKEKKKEENEDIIVGEKEVAFLLDKKKRITVHKFKGQLKIDIREYYEDNGEMKPGKRGLSLNLENWNKLKEFMEQIDEAIDNIK